jgi:glycosyltransferase involved in cell wall biosynthesis
MAERLTVLQVLPALEGGGVERGTLEIAAGLAAAGHRSLVMSAGGQLVSRLTGQGSEHFEWSLGRKSLFTLRHVGPLRRFLREQSVDVLHARSRMPAWVAWRAWRGMPESARLHFVTTVHGLYRVNSYSRIMTRGERVIVVSRAAADYVTRNYPKFDVARLRLIERGIDRKVYAYQYRPPASWLQRWYQECPYLLERDVLLLPGRISRLKGHMDFIGLMERLVRAGKPVYGLIVGGESREHEDYARELRDAIEQRGLQDYITFLGHRLDLRDIMSVSNVVLSLSQRPESFGRTVREALSLGVPVAGYDEGGVKESLVRAFPAGRVTPKDADALEHTVTRILEQRPQVQPCEFPSIQDMVDQTLAVYQKLAD